MQFSEYWLRNWVNPALDGAELANMLTMAGLEVEEITPVAPAFNNVVIAEVKALQAHENADRLRVAQVDVGRSDLVQIVCGAPNVAVGAKVLCALPGAILPGEFKIKPTKMRGVESNGMLCSAKELGLADETDGLLLLPKAAPVGHDVREYLQLDDHIFTLKITPNRADCLSIKGIAREVSTLTGSAWKPVDIIKPSITHQQILPVVIANQDACGHYLGCVIRGVNPRAKTPEWMQRCLLRSGLRSVSAIVDVTNYVLLELGQPLHAFDLAKIIGNIQVRNAKRGESLHCLNDKIVELKESTLVIADEEKVLALAGVMGGLESSVTDATQDIFLESAYFTPDAIAGRAREFGFSSDASYRYERGIDSTLQRDAIYRAIELLTLVCGGSAGALSEAFGNLPNQANVLLRTARVERVLGIAISCSQIKEILDRLGFIYTLDKENFSVEIPSFRLDLSIEEDLIEEVARVYGYENIVVKEPHSGLRMLPYPDSVRPMLALKQLLVQRDYQEVICYSFVNERWEADFAGNLDPVRLINPIASQMSVMRSSLIGSLVDALVFNLNRKQSRVRIFESSRVFLKVLDGFVQPEKTAGLAWGNRFAEQWAVKSQRVDFYDVKADIEAMLAPVVAKFVAASHPALHPGRTANILVDEVVVGVVGELHPQHVHAYGLSSAPIVFELDSSVLQHRQCVKAKAVAKSQPVRRDLALVVAQSVSADAVLSLLLSSSSVIVSDIVLFDLYQGSGIAAGYKSLAFRVLLQDSQKTLTDEDIDQVMTTLLQAVQPLGAVLRS